MALQVQQFAPETFEQANPILTGFNAANSAYQNAIQSQFALPNARQALQFQTLRNQILAPQAQYAPQITQADLALKQAQTPYVNAQTQELLQGKIPLDQAMASESYAKIPLYNAQANLANAQVPYVPMTSEARYMMGLGRLMPYTPMGMAARFQNSPQFQSLISQNPNLANRYTNIMANAIQNGALGSSPIPGMPSSIGAAIGGNSQTPVSISPQDVNAVQQAAGSEYITKTMPKNLVSQRYYENSVENMLGQVAPDLPDITSFAGLAGKADMAADKFAAATGRTSDPAYVKFNNFAKVQAPLIANEIRRAYGGQATDSERTVMDQLANPVYWNNNPQLAMNQMQTLVNSLKANAQALSLNPMQNLGATNASIANPLQISGNAPSSIGASIGIPTSIPKFSSKTDFQRWYAGLSKNQKDAVKSQLGSK